MLNAHDAFYSQPVIDGDKYDLVEQVLAETAEELALDGARVKDPQYTDGILSFSVEYIANDGAYEELPVEFLNRLLSEGVFENAGYSGYRITERSESKDVEPVNYVEFDVDLRVAGEQSAYHPEESETESEEVTAE